MRDILDNVRYEECIGITKEIDRIGRIVIPKEIRERLGFIDRVEMIITKEGLLIRNSRYELKEK